MIKIIEGSLFDSKANFIVNQASCQGNGISKQVTDKFPHVETEYNKYIRYCRKHLIDTFGTVQYVPTEVWALIMVDTMKNNNVIDYDTNYQYIVNLFLQDTFDGELHIDLKVIKNAFVGIRNKAEKNNATIAMPYGIGSLRGCVEWNDVFAIIKEVFEKSNVDVEIWRYNVR